MSTITLHQRAILEFLTTRDDATMSEINHHLGVDRNKKSHVTALASSGHITMAHYEDARRYSITDKGHRALRIDKAVGDTPPCAPRRSSVMTGDWTPAPWRPEVARPGCLDNVNLPSLQGSRRVYRKDAVGVPA